jgi:hypothetical protein
VKRSWQYEQWIEEHAASDAVVLRHNTLPPASLMLLALVVYPKGR